MKGIIMNTKKIYITPEIKIKKLKYKIARKQLKTSQNILKILSGVRIVKINIQ